MKRWRMLACLLFIFGAFWATAPTIPADAGSLFGNCGEPATAIHDIQGPGLSSPMVGTSGVVVEGIVVGDFQDTKTGLSGFFVQEEDKDADNDSMTSEGLFVNDNGFGVDVKVGDKVRVRGTVKEYYKLTELSAVTDLQVCGTTASPDAAVIELPVSDKQIWEQYEGMRILFSQPFTVTGNYNQGRYGEVDLSVNGRLMSPTNVVSPGPPAIELQDLNDRSRILLDDGGRMQNPPQVPYLGTDNTLRAGDTITGLTGIVDYAYSAYRIHPVQPVVFTRKNPRSARPQPVGGNLKVAGVNVLNYFNGDGSGGGFPTARGADTPQEFARQRKKAITAITKLDADIIGLMEMENDAPPNSAIEDLVSGLNAVPGAGTYGFIDTGVIGSDAIRVALIYKTDIVSPEGTYAILNSKVDPDFIDNKNRPSLAQTFRLQSNGAELTVVVNHLKSKGSSCGDISDPDIGDGQGNCNLTRTRAAQALTRWLAADPTGSNDPDFLIIGDLNAYTKEDPVSAIKAAGFVDLVDKFIGKNAYSYVFDGQAGNLDHALVSPDLAVQVTGVTEWHINADEPAALDYNDYNSPDLYQPDPFRAADHDPVLIGFNLTCNGTTKADLSITKTGPKTHIAADLDVVYLLDISNSGPDDAINVTVTDTLPENMVFIAAESAQGACESKDGVVFCTSGTISSGQELTISVVGRALSPGGQVNTAAVVSDTPDPVPANNKAEVITRVIPGVKLGVPKAVRVLRRS